MIERTIRLAKAFREDLDGEQRKKTALECIKCFYADMKIGGAMMTTSKCQICRTEIMFGSTCVNIVCVDCAKEHDLCIHCGADRELRPRRKKYHPKLEPVKPQAANIPTAVFLLPKWE
jgi:hypothetical protein